MVLKKLRILPQLSPSPREGGALMDSPGISVPLSHAICLSPALNCFHGHLVSVPQPPT